MDYRMLKVRPQFHFFLALLLFNVTIKQELCLSDADLKSPETDWQWGSVSMRSQLVQRALVYFVLGCKSHDSSRLRVPPWHTIQCTACCLTRALADHAYHAFGNLGTQNLNGQCHSKARTQASGVNWSALVSQFHLCLNMLDAFALGYRFNLGCGGGASVASRYESRSMSESVSSRLGSMMEDAPLMLDPPDRDKRRTVWDGTGPASDDGTTRGCSIDDEAGTAGLVRVWGRSTVGWMGAVEQNHHRS